MVFSATQEEKLLGRENSCREWFSLEIDVLDNNRQGPEPAREQNAASGSADGALLCWKMPSAPQRQQQYFLISSALVTAQNPNRVMPPWTHFEEHFHPRVVTAVLYPWHGPGVPCAAPKADVGSPTGTTAP